MNDENNPWKFISSKEIYKNPWLRLREDQVIRPDGEKGVYSVVETRVATGVVAFDEDDNVIMVGQYRYPLDEYSWEIVEGGAEQDEVPLEAIKRELVEEAGIVASEWESLGGEIFLNDCISSERCFLFVARGLNSVGSHPEGTEVLKIKKIPFNEVLKMVLNGQIKDSMTIMAILLVNQIRSKSNL